jgi:hypothetical protein
MAKFGVTMQRTASTTLVTGSLTAPGSNMRRAKIYDLVFGSEATPADNAFLWEVQRCTTAGTAGTNPTPVALDSADSLASTIVAGQAHTVNPTQSANTFALRIGLNQRATFRWVAAPGGELVIPATATNGFTFATPTATGLVAVSVTAHYDEQ